MQLGAARYLLRKSLADYIETHPRAAIRRALSIDEGECGTSFVRQILEALRSRQPSPTPDIDAGEHACAKHSDHVGEKRYHACIDVSDVREWQCQQGGVVRLQIRNNCHCNYPDYYTSTGAGAINNRIRNYAC